MQMETTVGIGDGQQILLANFVLPSVSAVWIATNSLCIIGYLNNKPIMQQTVLDKGYILMFAFVILHQALRVPFTVMFGFSIGISDSGHSNTYNAEMQAGFFLSLDIYLRKPKF